MCVVCPFYINLQRPKQSTLLNNSENHTDKAFGYVIGYD